MHAYMHMCELQNCKQFFVASLGSLVSGGSAYVCVPDAHDTL